MSPNIYFDNAATTPTFPEVVTSMVTTMEKFYANPSSLHKAGTRSQALLKQARQQIATSLGCQAEEIFFTSGGTEADNWAIKGTAWEKAQTGKHIITTKVEHPAVKEPMKRLEKQGFQVTYLDVDREGKIKIEDLAQAIRPDTILVSVMAINNEVGALQPIAAIGDLLNNYPTIHFHVDGVQSLGHFEKPLIHDRVDMLSLSAHKFNGPRGVGLLYKQANRKIVPLLEGGGQEFKQRSTTENLPGIVGMAKAMRLTLDQAPTVNQRHQKMMQKLRDFLADYSDRVTIFSPQDAASHVLCFALSGVRGEVMVHALEDEGIMVSTTSACSSRAQQASSTLAAMHVSNQAAKEAIRLSLGSHNQLEEMTRFISVYQEKLKHFERIQ
ncbi:aminotransferase V [Aerococcus urinaehominis]|uniref:Aminotransferase V n=2 Tax=Aerococcus urinaehominis TaxID=128944 RepID=A0A0X8FLV7_9LACT|nr:cysteine desulfurase family protein [Aerococcus urinaehominis]AMB99680.1 aminotransferase V [Aerococcus urinaehominis]SDL90130.1 cysteine desulfurase [Aerococcus urinaehominis]